MKRTIRMSDELAAQIDRARGDVPFERWARTVMERAADKTLAPVTIYVDPATMDEFEARQVERMREAGIKVWTTPVHRTSECGHPQAAPTAAEIKGCPDVIVRNCVVCQEPLWWNIDTWRKVAL